MNMIYLESINKFTIRSYLYDQYENVISIEEFQSNAPATMFCHDLDKTNISVEANWEFDSGNARKAESKVQKALKQFHHINKDIL